MEQHVGYRVGVVEQERERARERQRERRDENERRESEETEKERERERERMTEGVIVMKAVTHNSEWMLSVSWKSCSCPSACVVEKRGSRP